MINENDVAEMVDQVTAVLTEVQTENATLQKRAVDAEQKVLETERLLLEKVAAARRNSLDPEVMGKSVDFLINRGIVHPSSREKIASSLNDDPNNVFGLLTKVAEALMTAPGDGEGIPKEASSAVDAGDPDGWGVMARGGIPKIRA